MDLCMTHRFEDEHDCKPKPKTSELIEKIKTSNKTFSWGFLSGGKRPMQGGDVRVAKGGSGKG